MRQPILDPSRFTQWFNSVVPGAYRKLTYQDTRDMIECGLIGHYGYYGRTDLETVRGILLYEQLRQNRQRREEIRDNDGSIHCRRCGVKLVAEPDGRRGRPREYCPQCEQHRNRDRYLDWKTRREICRMRLDSL